MELELFKVGGAFALALFIVIRVIALLDKWLEGRNAADALNAKNATTAFDAIQKSIDARLDTATKTLDRSADIQEKAVEAYGTASRTYNEAARMIADELRLNRQSIDAVGLRMQAVPKDTQTLVMADLDEAVKRIQKYTIDKVIADLAQSLGDIRTISEENHKLVLENRATHLGTLSIVTDLRKYITEELRKTNEPVSSA